MSTHPQHTSIAIADTDVVRGAIAALPPVIDFLDAGVRFVPINTNRNWASGGIKRLLDLLVALPVLVVLSPLMMLIAAVIRIDSRGPALFGQRRSGICGRTFDILKFRTMHVVEDGDDVVQARDGDSRTTRVGRWLRRYSLDELPQLINVIRGDMSLVGPRPHAVVHDDYYHDRIADYRHRHAVKPGITGWAQVNGHRGPTPTIACMSRRVDFDVWYVRHASFALDLKILLRTPLEIFRPRNAF